MKIIKLRNARELVELEVSVEGLLHWHFAYAARGREFHSHWDQTAPFKHPLGYGSEIVHRFHPWEFELVNVSKLEREYTLNIIWSQGGAELGRWTQPGTLAAEDGDIVTNQAWLHLEEA